MTKDEVAYKFLAEGKLDPEGQSTEAGATIRITRVQFYDRITLVSGEITPDESHPLDSGILEFPADVSFDGKTAAFHGINGDASWEGPQRPRAFMITTSEADVDARSVTVRIGDSSVRAALL